MKQKLILLSTLASLLSVTSYAGGGEAIGTRGGGDDQLVFSGDSAACLINDISYPSAPCEEDMGCLVSELCKNIHASDKPLQLNHLQ